MHEFVLTLEELKKETGVSALDVAKALLDDGMHPPTMYFPLIVHEALMLEPTETESPGRLWTGRRRCTARLYGSGSQQTRTGHARRTSQRPNWPAR